MTDAIYHFGELDMVTGSLFDTERTFFPGALLQGTLRDRDGRSGGLFFYNVVTGQVFLVPSYSQGGRDWCSVGASRVTTCATLADSTLDSSKLFASRLLLAYGRLDVSDVPGSTDADSKMPEIPALEPLQWSLHDRAMIGTLNTPVLNYASIGPSDSPCSPVGQVAVVGPGPGPQALPVSLSPDSPRSPFVSLICRLLGVGRYIAVFCSGV